MPNPLPRLRLLPRLLPRPSPTFGLSDRVFFYFLQLGSLPKGEGGYGGIRGLISFFPPRPTLPNIAQHRPGWTRGLIGKREDVHHVCTTYNVQCTFKAHAVSGSVGSVSLSSESLLPKARYISAYSSGVQMKSIRALLVRCVGRSVILLPTPTACARTRAAYFMVEERHEVGVFHATMSWQTQSVEVGNGFWKRYGLLACSSFGIVGCWWV